MKLFEAIERSGRRTLTFSLSLSDLVIRAENAGKDIVFISEKTDGDYAREKEMCDALSAQMPENLFFQ